MRRWSLSLRLALFVALLGILLSGLLFALAYWTLERELHRQAHHYLHGRMRQVEVLLSQEPHVAALDADAQRFVDVLVGHEALHLAIALPTSRTPLVSFSRIGMQSLRVMPAQPTAAWHIWQAPALGTSAALLSLSGEARLRDGTNLMVVLTVHRSADRRLLRGFVDSALLTVPWILLGIGFGAWLLAYRSLRPLRRFRRAVASISARHLKARIETAQLPTELQELARAFNKMLGSLDDSVQRLSEFSADLAHEMRTPLSNLLGQTQVVLGQARSPDAYRAVLESNVEELERLSRLVRDMLFLAYADEAHTALQCEPLRLADEAQGVVEYFLFAAEEKALNFQVLGDQTVFADRSLLRRALSNLLSNALRHARSNTTIVLRLGQLAQGEVWIAIENEGEGIEPRHCLRLFERFYRAHPQSVRGQNSTGLGLAIVRSIMDLHGGEAAVSSVPGGLTSFRLIFPASTHTAVSEHLPRQRRRRRPAQPRRGKAAN